MMPRKSSNIKKSDQNKGWNRHIQQSKLQQDEKASQQQAIERAKKLFEKQAIYSAPHERNPITTIFELVEKLNAHF